MTRNCYAQSPGTPGRLTLLTIGLAMIMAGRAAATGRFPSGQIAHNGSPYKSSVTLAYVVTVTPGETEVFRVSLRVSGGELDRLVLRMTDNYGRVEHLAEVLSQIAIAAAGASVDRITEVDDFLWEANLSGPAPVLVSYAVRTVHRPTSLNIARLPYRDRDHLYFPTASALVYPDDEFLRERGLTIGAIQITFDLPQGWLSATSWGTGRRTYELSPPTLERLNSAFVGLGLYRLYERTVGALALDVAILNQPPVSDDAVVQTVVQAISSAYSLFGFVPVDHVFALIQFAFQEPDRGAGNALGSSINVVASRDVSPSRWRLLQSHVFHEIFHLWNGTEGAPLSRAPNDTATLWFTEGVTRFYGLKNMFVAGLVTEAEYLNFLGGEFTTLHHSSRRDDALDRLSSDYYSSEEAMRLTYSKGALVTFALDLLMRRTSLDRKGFDDVLRGLIAGRDYRSVSRPYTHQDIDRVLNEELGPENFARYRELFAEGFLDEFTKIVGDAGYRLVRQRGRKLYLGVRNFGPPGGPPSVLAVDRDCRSASGGLEAGDVLIMINGNPVGGQPVSRLVRESVGGADLVEVSIERSGRRMLLAVPAVCDETRLTIEKQE